MIGYYRSRHYAYVISVLFLVSLLSLNCHAESLSLSEVHRLSSKGDLVLVDIRSDKEWRDTGVAPQALLLSMHTDTGVSGFAVRLNEYLKGDKHRKVALVCAGGVRSLYIQHYLQKQGYTQVVNVSEGMVGGISSKGWIDEELPIVPYVVPYVK